MGGKKAAERRRKCTDKSRPHRKCVRLLLGHLLVLKVKGMDGWDGTHLHGWIGCGLVTGKCSGGRIGKWERSGNEGRKWPSICRFQQQQGPTTNSFGIDESLLDLVRLCCARIQNFCQIEEVTFPPGAMAISLSVSAVFAPSFTANGEWLPINVRRAAGNLLLSPRICPLSPPHLPDALAPNNFVAFPAHGRPAGPIPRSNPNASNPDVLLMSMLITTVENCGRLETEKGAPTVLDCDL